MRYGFINNFSQTLAADLAAGAATMTLDGGGSSLSNASADLVYTLTLDDGEGTVEIVHVTGATGNDLTIERGKEGTTDAAWPPGSTAEMRVTAGYLGTLVITDDNWNITTKPKWGSVGRNAGAEFAIALGDSTEVSSFSAAIGDGCVATGVSSLSVGGYNEATGDYSISLGYASEADYANAISMGNGAGARGVDTIAIGRAAAAWNPQSISIGADITSFSDGGITIGGGATIYSEHTIAIGQNADVSSQNDHSILISPLGGSVNAKASIGIGSSVETTVDGGVLIAGLSYVPSGEQGPASLPTAAKRTGMQVALSTPAIDLTDGAAVVSLDMPSGSMLFIDAIDVVITGSDTPGGSPEIVVGPDDVAPAAYLAATAIGKTTVGGRETHAPIVDDGVTSLRVATTTAGTGTDYQAKVIFRGYVMEL